MTDQLKTDDLIELHIDSVAHGGDGIARHQGQVVFVTGAFPGDEVQARITRLGKRAAWASLEKLLAPGTCRIEDHQTAALACASSCLWHDFSYPLQMEWKVRIVTDTLKRIGGIDVEVGWLDQQELRQGYRTRATFHGNGRELGYYIRRSHEIRSVEPCPSNHARLNASFAALQGCAIVGDVQVTINPEGDETLVFLREANTQVLEKFPLANTAKDKGRHSFLFDGTPIVNGSFSQASLLLNRMLKEKVDAAIGNATTILDLYCGSGNFSLHHGQHKKVLGIDNNPHAIHAAQKLAGKSYQRGYEKEMVDALKDAHWEAVLLDPPRTGAAQLSEHLKESSADRIVYVSCDPATLARDLKTICSTARWEVCEVTAVDMFPHTPHVEAVALLQRK